MLAEGDPNPRHSVPGHGAIHPHEVILLILGVAGALVLRGPGPSFILWWIAVAPIAASLTIDPRHAVRAIPMLPGLHAAIGLGAAILVHGATRTPAGARRAIAFGILVVMVAAALAITGGYLTDYHLMWPVVSGEAWQYGLKEAYAWVDDHLEAHDSVYVTRNEDYPWIHLIFHRGMNPREFQRDGLSGTPYLFDQEVFYRGDAVPGRRNPVFILKPWEVDPRLTRQHVVRYPDGKEALVIAW